MKSIFVCRSSALVPIILKETEKSACLKNRLSNSVQSFLGSLNLVRSNPIPFLLLFNTPQAFCPVNQYPLKDIVSIADSCDCVAPA